MTVKRTTIIAFLVRAIQAVPPMDIGYVYSVEFFGEAAITNLTRDDAQSALSMMELARMIVYMQCPAAPYLDRLTADYPFTLGSFGNDTLSPGSQADIGKILAYAAASAQESTLTADLRSVFEAVFGYAPVYSYVFCDTINMSPPTSNLNIMMTAANSTGQLPTTAQDIEAWINFIRVSSGMDTQIPSTNLTAGALFASNVVLNSELYEQTTMTSILVNLVTDNRNLVGSSLISRNWAGIVASPAFTPEMTALIIGELFVFMSGTRSDPLATTINWALESFALSETATIIMGALCSFPGDMPGFIGLLASIVPNFNLERSENTVYVLNAIVDAFQSADPVTLPKFKAGLFWLLAESTGPISVPVLIMPSLPKSVLLPAVFIPVLQGCWREQDIGTLYRNTFNGSAAEGLAPITILTRDDSQSALAMLEFARAVVYSPCSQLPYVEGLVASPPFGGNNFGSDSLAAGAQAEVGKILAYAAASAVNDTMNADLQSVMDPIFGIISVLAVIVCLPPLPGTRSKNSNLLLNHANSTQQLPKTSQDIEAWVNFLRISSGLATQTPTTNLSSAASFVSSVVGIYDLSPFSNITSILVNLVTDNRDPTSSSLIDRNWAAILSNMAWQNSLSNLVVEKVFNLMSATGQEPLSPMIDWALNSFALSDTASISIAAFLSILGPSDEVVEIWAHLLPDFKQERAENLLYVLNLILTGFATADSVVLSNLKAGLFWLWAHNTRPDPIPTL